MTQKDKKLNCLNCRIGDFKHSLCDCHNGFCAKYKGIGKQEDFFMAIETLSKPNYESDNEVRLAVTNRKKKKRLFCGMHLVRSNTIRQPMED